ncbi:MAG: N-acetylglucosamine-6-phosphate deacetylase [Anaerolineales bacterium]|nr:N-acetylglucosamine-6-phosphate deacetylase [Anaerolineales bacterium]
MEEYPQRFSIHNVNLLEDGQLIEDGMILIDEGCIRFAGRRADFVVPEDLDILDGNGWYAAPGFIDLQLNGAYGVDFTCNPEKLVAVAELLPKSGVTAFLPTIITSPLDEYSGKLQAILAAQAATAEPADSLKTSARVFGAHLEGPFLNPQMPGAHQASLFQQPTSANLQKFAPLEAVYLMTLAVEMSGGLEAISWLRERNITPSIGHSAASAELVGQAFSQGLSYATHLFNAMPPLHHRNPGLVGAVLGSEKARCGLIVDGIHLHPLTVKLVYRALGAGRLTLVTDAMAAMGMPPGSYRIAGREVIAAENSARLQDGRLAGSLLSMDQAVCNMVTFSGCSLAEAVRMASTTPAEVLGIDDQFGHLKAGYVADMVLLDKALQVQVVYVGGRLAFSRE